MSAGSGARRAWSEIVRQEAGQGRYCGRPPSGPPPSFTRLTGVCTRASKAPRGGAGTRTRDMSSTAFIASRRRSNARAPLTRTGFHPLGRKYVGNSTVKTGRRLSSVTFTVHRRKSGAQSAKEEIIITRFIRRTAMECAAARSLTSLPMSSGKS
jgi:hypothetical protein